MFSKSFGIEVEFTGITRQLASETIAGLFGSRSIHEGGTYDKYRVIDPSGRLWRFVFDSSIRCERKGENGIEDGDRSYSVELVTPPLFYEQDMDTLQNVIRKLRSVGGFANRSCGIHVHVDGQGHSVRTLINLINIIASRNHLFYKALQVEEARQQYCQMLDSRLVSAIKQKRPGSMSQLEDIWYECLGKGENRFSHYNASRYYFLNLHCFFNGNGTVEFRGFNSELHAGKIRAYVAFALAINHQALTQTSAHAARVETDNEKFAMRIYLVRIGLSGDEFKACRQHLYRHLSGNAAWRYGSKEACHSHRTSKEKQEVRE